jgi:subtilisin family serine protease
MDYPIEINLESLSAASTAEIVNKKVKFNIIAKSRNDKNFIYDYLTNPLSGCSCLSGVKTCLGKHDYLEKEIDFEFTSEEYERVSQLDQVESISLMGEESIDYTKESPIPGVPRISNYSSADNNIAHHLYYGQNYTPTKINNQPFNDNVNISLSSIDCSNVDIVILDTGVDSTHNDFLDNQGNSRVVDFDWTQLKDPADVITGEPIVSSQSSNYYQDTNGHGTSCASLAAGNRMGFAKNARIYSLRSNGLGGTTDGFNTFDCIKLMISFQKSKKLNLYGLDSNRPTVMSNSWGYGLYVRTATFLTIDNNDNNTFDLEHAKKFAHTVNNGKGASINRISATNTTTDEYFRQILNEGVHVLTAAGNSNMWLSNPGVNIKALYTSYSLLRVILQDKSAWSAYQTDDSLAYGHTILGRNLNFNYGYGSPNIGDGYSKNDYPIINVGCVAPVGDDNSITSDLYASAAQPKSTYNILSSTNSNEIIFDSRVRYNTLNDDFFCKSNYSNFGPDVDIYAPGAGNWAALSNQVSVTSPTFTATDDSVYRYFDGTSSACPIVAGILATYLADYPNSSNQDARNWLLTNSISGNILQAESQYITLSTYDSVSNVESTFNVPFVANYDQLEDMHIYKIKRYTADLDSILNLYNTGSFNDLIFNCCLHGDSHNRIAQAYPLRKAILQTNGEDSISFSSTTLNLSSTTPTQEPITHPNYS